MTNENNMSISDAQRLKQYRHFYFESRGLDVPPLSKVTEVIIGKKTGSYWSKVELGVKPMPPDWKETISDQLGYPFEDFRYDIGKKFKATERLKDIEFRRGLVSKAVAAIIKEVDINFAQLGRVLLPHWSNPTQGISTILDAGINVEDSSLYLVGPKAFVFERKGLYGKWKVNPEFLVGTSEKIFVPFLEHEDDVISIEKMKMKVAEVLSDLGNYKKKVKND